MNIQTIWVFDYFFLCSSYRYIIYMQSHSNLCHNNLTSTYYVRNVSSLIFDREKSTIYSRLRISNVWEKSTFQIQQNCPAFVGFLPEPDFCRIWKKGRIPAGARARAEIWYSPSVEPPLDLCLDFADAHYISLQTEMYCQYSSS